MKEQVVVGFYLRALRICSPRFLDAELDYVTATFKRLMYPTGLLVQLLKRAKHIRSRPTLTQDQLDARRNVNRMAIPLSLLVDDIQALVDDFWGGVFLLRS